MKKVIVFIFMIFFSLNLFAEQNESQTYSFAVLPQRNPILTAQYWNPILSYIGKKTNLNFELKIAKTTPEMQKNIELGVYDFIYSNTTFKPQARKYNYQAIITPIADKIKCQIVTLKDSHVSNINELRNQEVGFPSPEAFIAYAVPMDFLHKKNITVKPIFGGNQEGIMGQLKNKKIEFAAVNNLVMQDYANREKISYSVIWESEEFMNLPIVALPTIPKDIIEKIVKAFVEMNNDEEGIIILKKSAQIIQQTTPLGFHKTSNNDYKNYINFYNHISIDLE